MPDGLHYELRFKFNEGDGVICLKNTHSAIERFKGQEMPLFFERRIRSVRLLN